MLDIEIFHITNDNSNFDYKSVLDKNPDSLVSLLIDDYNFDHCIYNIPSYILAISNTIAFEASFCDIASKLIQNINTSNRNNIIYLNNSNIILNKCNKWSCALLTALWYAARLGVIDHPKGTFKRCNKKATQLLNILDIKHKPSEKKALKIFKALFPEFAIKDVISYIYY